MSKQTDRLKRRLDAIPKAVKEAVVPALMQSGHELADMQRRLAPVDSGDLRDSIAVTAPGHATPAYSQPGGSQIASENQVLVTAGNSEVRYSHLVEHGSTLSPAQPYFFPAYRLLRKRIASRLKRSIGKAVRTSR